MLNPKIAATFEKHGILNHKVVTDFKRKVITIEIEQTPTRELVEDIHSLIHRVWVIEWKVEER